MSCTVAARRSSVDPNPGYVHIRITRGHLLDHRNVVFKRSAQVSVRKLVECPRSSGRAASVHHHSDKTEFCRRLQKQTPAKILGYKKRLGSRVDELNNRVFLSRIEIRRAPDQSKKVRRAVPSFPLKRLREFPPQLHQRASIGLLQNAHLRTVFRPPQHSLPGQVWPRITIHKERTVWGNADGMIRILRRKQLKSSSIKPDAVEMRLVWVLVLLASVRREVDSAGLFVDVLNSPDNPGPLGNLVYELSSLGVKIQMIPPVSFRRPDDLPGAFDETIERFPGINVRIGLFTQQNFLLSGRCVHQANFLRLKPAIIAVVPETLTVGEPIESRSILKRQFDGGGFHINSLSGLNVEDDRLRLRQHFPRQWINIGERSRAQLTRRYELQAREPARIS